MKFITPIIAALLLTGCKEEGSRVALSPAYDPPQWEEVCTSYGRVMEYRWTKDVLGHVSLTHRILRPCKAKAMLCVTGEHYNGDMTCDDLGPKPEDKQ